MPPDDEDQDSKSPRKAAGARSADYLDGKPLFTAASHHEDVGQDEAVPARKVPQIAQLLPQTPSVWDVQDLENMQVQKYSNNQDAAANTESVGQAAHSGTLDGRKAGQDILRMLGNKSEVVLNPEVSSFVPARYKEGDGASSQGDDMLEPEEQPVVVEERQAIRPLMEKMVEPTVPCSLLPTGQVSPRYILLSSRMMGPTPRPDVPPRYLSPQQWRPAMPRARSPSSVWPGFIPVSQPSPMYAAGLLHPKEPSGTVYYPPHGHLFYAQADNRPTMAAPPTFTAQPPSNSNNNNTSMPVQLSSSNNTNVQVQVATLIPVNAAAVFQPVFPHQHVVLSPPRDQQPQ